MDFIYNNELSCEQARFTKCIQCSVKSEVRGSIWFQITKFSLNFSPDTGFHVNFIRNSIYDPILGFHSRHF
jgi:hypothetical protein